MDNGEGLAGMEAQAGDASGGVEERASEASLVRQPQSDLGKDPLVAEEPVDMESIFVGTGTSAGSSRPIGMGDFLESASVEDLAETLRVEPRLATVLLAAYKEERQADKEEVLVPRRTVVEEARMALRGRGLFEKESYMPFLHAVEPSHLEAYKPRRAMYDEMLVLRDRLQHLSE